MELKCSQLVSCHFPGAYCAIEEGGEARCVCDTITCDEEQGSSSRSGVVCADDGQTYASECDLMKFACVKQLEIRVAYHGQCTQGIYTRLSYLHR